MMWRAIANTYLLEYRHVQRKPYSYYVKYLDKRLTRMLRYFSYEYLPPK